MGKLKNVAKEQKHTLLKRDSGITIEFRESEWKRKTSRSGKSFTEYKEVTRVVSFKTYQEEVKYTAYKTDTEPLHRFSNRDLYEFSWNTVKTIYTDAYNFILSHYISKNTLIEKQLNFGTSYNEPIKTGVFNDGSYLGKLVITESSTSYSDYTDTRTYNYKVSMPDLEQFIHLNPKLYESNLGGFDRNLNRDYFFWENLLMFKINLLDGNKL